MIFKLQESYEFPTRNCPSIQDLGGEMLFKDDSFVVLATTVEDGEIVFEYTLKGEFIRQIGRPGKGLGEYSGPTWLTLDPWRKVYVYDGSCSGTGKILIYEEDGSFFEDIERHEHLPYTHGFLFDDQGDILHLSKQDAIEEDSGIIKLRRYPNLKCEPQYVQALIPREMNTIGTHFTGGFCYQPSTTKFFFQLRTDYQIKEIDAETGGIERVFGIAPPGYRPLPEKYYGLGSISTETGMELRTETTLSGKMILLGERYLLANHYNFTKPFPPTWIIYDLDSVEREGKVLEKPAFDTSWVKRMASKDNLLYVYHPPGRGEVDSSNGHMEIYSYSFSVD